MSEAFAFDGTILYAKLSSFLTRRIPLQGTFYPRSGSSILRPFVFKLLSLELTASRAAPISASPEHIRECVAKNISNLSSLIPTSSILPRSPGRHPLHELSENSPLISFLRLEYMKARYLPELHSPSTASLLSRGVLSGYTSAQLSQKLTTAGRIRFMEVHYLERNLPVPVAFLRTVGFHDVDGRGREMFDVGVPQATTKNRDFDHALPLAREGIMAKLGIETTSNCDVVEAADGAAASTEEALEKVRSLSIPEVLEAAGCGLRHLTSFNLYCELKQFYTFYTAEYVSALYSHIQRSASSKPSSSPATAPRRVLILEVGAGDGRLSTYLSGQASNTSSFSSSSSNTATVTTTFATTVIATDDGSWGLRPLLGSPKFSVVGAAPSPASFPPVPVERLSVSGALSKHARPENDFDYVVVLCAWMPSGVDFSEAIRASKAVDEYILIGEVGQGVCGKKWETWGQADGNERAEGSQPPFEVEGWEMTTIEKPSKHMIGRYCTAYEKDSKTVSFKKKSR